MNGASLFEETSLALALACGSALRATPLKEEGESNDV